MTPSPQSELPFNEIQGDILRPYGHGFPFGCYLLLRVRASGSAIAALSTLASQVTTAAPWDKDSKPPSTLNLAFSHAGLQALKVKQEWLDGFPDAFKQGMRARASILGDTEESSPDRWHFGGPASDLHVLLTIYGQTSADLKTRVDQVLASVQSAGESLELAYRQDASLLPVGREHFGFMDGISQPSIQGSGEVEPRGNGTPRSSDGWEPLKTGEFLLGYANESGGGASPPAPGDIYKNGTFLAFRKLGQRVPEFRSYLHDAAKKTFNIEDTDTNRELIAAKRELIAAKMVGRWRSGCPLSLSTDRDNPELALNNDFRYKDDPKGIKCPIGSHIRRMNPRDAFDGTMEVNVKLHRISRRGLPYGTWLASDTDDGQDRGIVFIALCADLAHQFEFVQQQWANNGEFANLDESEKDPIIGGGDGPTKFKMPQSVDGPKWLFKLPRFVLTRGGEYFFVPSITALRDLLAPR
jgi:Dyp-type peroxidase family